MQGCGDALRGRLAFQRTDVRFVLRQRWACGGGAETLSQARFGCSSFSTDKIILSNDLPSPFSTSSVWLSQSGVNCSQDHSCFGETAFTSQRAVRQQGQRFPGPVLQRFAEVLTGERK